MANKKKVIGMKTGYMSSPTNPGDQWEWGKHVYTGGNSSEMYRLGGHSGSLNSSFDDNTGASWMKLIIPKSLTGTDSVLYDYKLTSKPKVFPHYEDGKSKEMDYSDDPSGWQLQTKAIKNGDDLENHKNKVLWWYSYGQRKTLYSWCWSSFHNNSTVKDVISINSAEPNDDPAKAVWWGHLVQGGKDYINSKSTAAGYGSPHDMSNSRLRNVVGFTCNCMIRGEDNSWMHPQTIGLIMHRNQDKFVRIAIPTEGFGSTQHLTQNIIDDTYWHNGSQSSIDSAEWKGAIKNKVLELNYICTQDVITEIVSGKWEFMGVWWKMGSHCSKSSGHHSRQCGIWNFRPIICGQEGSVGSTWNNNRYNILGNQRKSWEKKSLYLS